MSDDDTVVFGEGITKTSRTLKSGTVKSRFSIDIKSEKLVHNFSAKRLGKGPAEAILKVLRERIQGITDIAAPNTLRARRTALAAVVRGEAWAMKRYSGGKTGTTVPDQSDRLFNDSGRLANGLAIRQLDDKWVVYAPANRLNPDLVNGKNGRGGEAGLLAIWERLKQAVPELGDPDLLGDNLDVARAIREQKIIIGKATADESIDLVLEIIQEAVEEVAQFDELASEAG